MAIIPIRTIPDPVLRQKGRRVKNIDGSIHRLVDDMLESMRTASGVGLAAPQVGVAMRVVVIQLPEQEEIVLINPQIVRKTGEIVGIEGCLSIPGYFADVSRAAKVTVKALDRDGKETRLKGEDLLARAMQHEIDHLNGVLYIDYLDSLDELRPVEMLQPEEASDPLAEY
jgi:peptide deformylase